MSSINKNLDKIEMQLRMLFEDRITNFFTGERQQPSFINALIEQMQQNIKLNDQNQLIAPDRFVIHVPRKEIIKWQIHQDILDEIVSTLYLSGQAEGYLFHQPPAIELQADQEAENTSFFISVHSTKEPYELPDTSAMTQSQRAEMDYAIPEDAFLIIGGRENYPLDKNIIDIGRHSSNDLVLDDPHLSRHHAQLRAIKGHFVIFDVGSTGGIYINGKQISQATLQTGDVIRLGMTNFIYVQASADTHPTTALPPNLDEDVVGDLFE